MGNLYVPVEEQEEVHLKYMDSALQMAEEAMANGEVPVGCVFVRNNVVIAQARNRTNELRNASRHAELEAIDEIISDPVLTPPSIKGTNKILADTILYVTVEPCIMCASALRQLGIQEVYFGCTNERFGGCGSVLGVNESIPHPVHAPFKCTYGYRRDEAIMILRRFYMTENSKAPVPKSKAKRVLKTDIRPVNLSPSPTPPTSKESSKEHKTDNSA